MFEQRGWILEGGSALVAVGYTLYVYNGPICTLDGRFRERRACPKKQLAGPHTLLAIRDETSFGSTMEESLTQEEMISRVDHTDWTASAGRPATVFVTREAVTHGRVIHRASTRFRKTAMVRHGLSRLRRMLYHVFYNSAMATAVRALQRSFSRLIPQQKICLRGGKEHEHV
jgi:hypothetical protein